MFVLRRPDESFLREQLQRAQQLPYSYAPLGLARGNPPSGFRAAEEGATLGHGEEVFARAVQGLREWRQFRLGWASIFPSEPPLEEGTDVLVIASHVGFWSVNACRISYLLGPSPGTVPEGRDCPHPEGLSPKKGTALCAGFAYGTLNEHAETGEEIFQVSLDPGTGEVTYLVRAVSRERAPLARVGFPVARALQARFRRDSAAAMQRWIAESSRCQAPSGGATATS